MAIKIDIHNHSRHGSFDGLRSYDEIATECRAKGLDVVVITEHDTLTDTTVLAEVSARYGLLLLPGIEVSFDKWGHFLVLGGDEVLHTHCRRRCSKKQIVEHLDRLREKIVAWPEEYIRFEDFGRFAADLRAMFKGKHQNPADFARAARACGGYVSWAHPFVGSCLAKAFDCQVADDGAFDLPRFLSYLAETEPEILEVAMAVDAFEGLNGRYPRRHSDLACAFARLLDKPTTAGSDAHGEGEFGVAFMVVNANRTEVVDVASLVQVLKNRERSLEKREFS
jgi:predicted metal-dependent phosphoesterase TrpH